MHSQKYSSTRKKQQSMTSANAAPIEQDVKIAVSHAASTGNETRIRAMLDYGIDPNMETDTRLRCHHICFQCQDSLFEYKYISLYMLMIMFEPPQTAVSFLVWLLAHPLIVRYQLAPMQRNTGHWTSPTM